METSILFPIVGGTRCTEKELFLKFREVTVMP